MIALAGGCLFFEPVEFAPQPPVALASFDSHADPPRGVDYRRGEGEAVTSPIHGRVRFAGLTQAGKYVGMKIEDDLGFWVITACHSKILVAPNQTVTPLTVIAREGWACGFGPGGPGLSHTHVTLHLPPFAREFGAPDGRYIARNGVEYLIADPDKYAAGGKKLGYYLADFEDQSALVKEATERLDGIGKDFHDTHLGWFLNRTRDRRPFIRAMVMYRMWQTGTLNPKARERAEEYFRWHAALKIPVYLPYPNPEIPLSYTKPDPEPSTPKDVEKLWETNVAPLLAAGKDKEEILKAIQEFHKQSPLQGEAGTELHLGIAYSTLENYEEAVEHMLIAEALSEVHYWNVPRKVNKFKYFAVDLLMKAYWGAKELTLPEAYRAKRNRYARWRNIPW